MSVFSDIVVQIVDARNPLLFRCPDLVGSDEIAAMVGKKVLSKRHFHPPLHFIYYFIILISIPNACLLHPFLSVTLLSFVF